MGRLYYQYRGKLKSEPLKEETLKSLIKNREPVILDIWNKSSLEKVLPLLNLSDISVEDLTTENPVKLDEFENYLFLVLYKPYITADDWDYEQISVVFKDRLVMIFRAEKSEQIIKRAIRTFFSKKPVTIEYFIYIVIEKLLSEYSGLVDFIELKIRELEKQITDPEAKIIEQAYDIRDLILDIKQILAGYRDVVFALKSNPRFVRKKDIFYYIRDLYEKVSDIYRDVENLQERTANLMSVYLLYANIAFGDTMQVLTALTTIFLPMTLIASIYGMNFRFMPELYHPLGYYFALFLIFGVGIIAYIILKKKKLV